MRLCGAFQGLGAMFGCMRFRVWLFCLAVWCVVSPYLWSALLIVCCAFCDSRDIMSVGRRARHTKGTNGCVARCA